ncbi:hypothetical protein PPROV_000171300 [Pycnococcus provasolii]|uniref:Ribulose bisphosphate carboxylase/oxygenase activase, chloroplastic n=1 Tax=Pycnococcus provasolii TaxID=41880 RepID=A0A830H8E9_9CHLO|nr:hypothetical protein PPROV_000171300 [Pycnococcus provasolii]
MAIIIMSSLGHPHAVVCRRPLCPRQQQQHFMSVFSRTCFRHHCRSFRPPFPPRSSRSSGSSGSCSSDFEDSEDLEETFSLSANSPRPGKPLYTSSWNAVEAWRQDLDDSSDDETTPPPGPQEDYLYELGRQSSNMNIDMGANSKFLDSKFAGQNSNFTMGAESDIASGRYRFREGKEYIREFANLGEASRYYVSPRFVDRIALHVVKNVMAQQEKTARNIPLILGIWGEKGQGKTFQLELTCRVMGMTPVVMSAGELEDEEAGRPGQLIRERYRAAANLMKRAGKMSCLIINDVDAGVGRMGDNQYTVNCQMVMGTLMNICDHPERVSGGGDWLEGDTLPRTPIIVTGNDLSTLYAPLIRDGRMDKFFWNPNRDDMRGTLSVLFDGDGYTAEQLDQLLDAFPKKSMDFFGALRARTFDDAIRQWCLDMCGGVKLEWDAKVDLKWLNTLVTEKGRASLPRFEAPPPSLERLIELGNDLDRQARLVEEENLAMDYFKNLEFELEPHELAAQKQAEKEERRRRAIAQGAAQGSLRIAQDSAAAKEIAALAEDAMEQVKIMQEEAAARAAEEEAAAAAANAWTHPWPRLKPDDAHARVFDDGWTWVDIRTAKEFNRETLAKAVSVPSAVFTGTTMLDWATEAVPLAEFRDALSASIPNHAEARVVAIPPTDDNEASLAALAAMHDLGFAEFAQVTSFDDYCFNYTPVGKKRPPVGSHVHVPGAPGTVCVGSDLPVVHKESARTIKN